MRHHRGVLVFAAASLVLAAMLLGTACGDDGDGDEAEVEAAV